MKQTEKTNYELTSSKVRIVTHPGFIVTMPIFIKQPQSLNSRRLGREKVQVSQN